MKSEPLESMSSQGAFTNSKIYPRNGIGPSTSAASIVAFSLAGGIQQQASATPYS